MKLYRSRAPLRLGLAGGGTDVSPYCDRFSGQILNATINHHAHCTIEPLGNGSIEFFAQDIDKVEKHFKASNLDASNGLSLHRELYNLIVERFNDGKPLSFRMFTHSDAPPGSGLGSSSTLVVAMVQAYAEWLKLPLGEYDVAFTAYEVERIRLKQTGGRQDQYAAAFGGVNFMEFYAEERVIVNPLRVKKWIINEFEASCVLYYSSVSRYSSAIIEEQIDRVRHGSKEALEATHSLKRDAVKMKEALLKGDLSKIASVLGQSWQAKKKMAAGITNSGLDQTMEAALRSGAIAGKITGAGGGGFMMLIVEPQNRIALEKELNVRGGTVLPFRFSSEGVESWTLKR